MVGPAAGQQREAQARPRCGRTTTGFGSRWPQNTPWDEFVREHRHRHGQHAGERRGELLRAAPGRARPGRDDVAGVSGHVDRLRQVPQPSAGEMDQRPILRDGQPVRAREGEGRPAATGTRSVFTVDRGDLLQPNKGKPQPPRPLDADAVSFDATKDRRDHLADWLVSPDNPYFARAITNRVWANFLASAWSNRSTTCGLPTRPATKSY